MGEEREGADDWGITHGYHDIAGTWHPTEDHVRASLREAMGDPFGYGQTMPQLWFMVEGEEHTLWNQCRIVLEDGSDWGPHGHLPGNLPIGYHRLIPLDGSAATQIFVRPGQLPSAPESAWGVAVQLYAMLSESSQGIGDLVDLADLARIVRQRGGGMLLVNPLHAPAPGFPQQNSPYYASSRLWRNPLFLRVGGMAPCRGDSIDRNAVWEAKRGALWNEFVSRSYDRERFQLWVAGEGESLYRYATWAAQREGEAEADAVEFQCWLQWRILAQLLNVGVVAPDVVLVGDLAIGFDPFGADAAEFAALLAPGCRIGSPPDAFNADGQDWGLPPFVPWRLRATGYDPLIRTFRAAFNGFHGLRIDHVMGLFRQFWLVPLESGVRAGAYVQFAHDEILSILAIEAVRAGGFVVGEDLGTVQPVVWEAMGRDGMLGTTVAWFEADPPSSYRRCALATITTHDLPTIAGVWTGADGDSVMRDRILALTGVEDDAPTSAAIVEMHRALASAPSQLRAATTDDLCAAVQRPNVPGTTDDQRNNWCIPLPVTLDEMASSTLFAEVTAVLNGDSEGF